MPKPRRHTRHLGTVLASLAIGLALLAVGCQPSAEGPVADSAELRTVRIEPGPDAARRLQEALIMA